MDACIESLAAHLDLAPVVAKWLWDEWVHLDDPNSTLEEWTQRVAARDRVDVIPATYVALRSAGELVGTVSLTAHDLAIRPELTPWLAALYVPEHARGQGIGRALVEHVEARARTMHIVRLYLYTDTAQGLYEKCGWQLLERVEFRDKLGVVMERVLNS